MLFSSQLPFFSRIFLNADLTILFGAVVPSQAFASQVPLGDVLRHLWLSAGIEARDASQHPGCTEQPTDAGWLGPGVRRLEPEGPSCT